MAGFVVQGHIYDPIIDLQFLPCMTWFGVTYPKLMRWTCLEMPVGTVRSARKVQCTSAGAEQAHCRGQTPPEPGTLTSSSISIRPTHEEPMMPALKRSRPSSAETWNHTSHTANRCPQKHPHACIWQTLLFI